MMQRIKKTVINSEGYLATMKKLPKFSKKIYPMSSCELSQADDTEFIQLNKIPSISRSLYEEDDFFPAISGYMLKDSVGTYSENMMRLILDMDRLQDTMKYCLGYSSISDKFQDIDSHVNILERCETSTDAYQDVFLKNVVQVLMKNTEPTPTVLLENGKLLKTQAETIFHQYFEGDESPYEIFIPSDLVFRTCLRMKYSSLYGHHVFSEALEFALGTIPNLHSSFLETPTHTKLMSYIKLCRPLPSKETLQVPYPNDEHEDSLEFISADQINYDSRVYESLLSYSKLSGSEGCVLGYRLLFLFHDALYRHQKDLLEDLAWTIYRYYVATGSCYQLPLSSIMVNEIMRNLATPTNQMFDYLYQIIKDQCDIIFQDFIGSKKESICITPCSTYEASEDQERNEGRSESYKPRRRQSVIWFLRGLFSKKHSI